MFFAWCISGMSVKGQDYTFRRYTATDGLAGQDVHCILEDSNGFLWIGTGNGLSRFDGKSFKNYGYTEGLTHLMIISLFQDTRGRLWIGTTKGIAELQGNRLVMHGLNDKNEGFVMSFGEFDSYGLIAFTSRGTYRYNDSTWAKITLLPGYEKRVCLEMVSMDNGLYMNFEDELIFKSQGSDIVSLLKDTTDGSEKFCNGIVTKNGKVFAGVQNRLYEITNGRLQVIIDGIPITRFFDYTMDTSGVCWINIEDKGLYKYDLHGGISKFISLSEYDSNTAGIPYIDKHGNLWITSYEGLIKVLPKVFEELTPPKVAGAAKRLIVIPGVANEMLFSDASGLNVLRNNKVEHLQKPSSYSNDINYGVDVVEGSAKDNRNYTWMITRQRRILCWDGAQLMDYSRLLAPRPGDYIQNLAVNPVNNTVFLCDDTTLVCGNEKHFGVYVDDEGKRFTKTTTVLFTHNGIGLVNVFSKGVYFITRQNKIVKAPRELDIVDKGNYTYFFEDREGWIWISNAGKGLIHFRIDENTYQVSELTVLTTEQGLPANKISGLKFDLEGGIWVSCSNGLVVLKHNPANRNLWDVYPIGKEQNIQLSAPTTFARDRSGNMWVASLDQLKMIHTSDLVLKKLVPKVVIEKVLLDMKETNWRNYSDSVKGYLLLPTQLKLKHYQNTLGIEFTGISLYNADYFEYSYQLEPSEKSWSAPSSNRFISLVNLAPGKYLFKVRARGKGTGWSEPQFFSFTINSPFWGTWWFLSLIFLLAATIVISIYRNRIQKIQKEAELQAQLREMEMKALKAQMNPHFIYNALNSIQSLIADERKSEAINYIGTFSRLLRQVLEYSETTVITLDKELQTLNLYIQLESLRLNMDLEYNVSTDNELLPENEKIPPLILQPFIENALWHGLSRKNGRKQLSIFISQQDNYLTCAVEDNGIGRANAMAYKKKSALESYTSRGTDITIRRLIDFNRVKELPVVYHDILDMQGQAAGTKVIINIKRHGLTPGLPDSH